MKLNYLYKIYIASGLFLVVVGVLFGYAFPWAHAQNEAIAARLVEKSIEYKALEVEQRSFQAGQRDLAELAKKDVKPSDLFSQDIRLVTEIETLEFLASKGDLDMTLQISGTVTDAKKVPQSIANIFLIPYTMTVIGDYGNLMKFMEEVEHTPFVTQVNAIVITAVSGSEVRATLNGSFYIKK
jgi:Tfp pilus assembly protein PilO